MSKTLKENEEKRTTVSLQAHAKYMEMKEVLKEKEMNEFSFSLFLDLILKKVPESTIAQIIEENTPKEYKIKLALQDEVLRDEILRLYESREKKRQKDKSTEVVL